SRPARGRAAESRGRGDARRGDRALRADALPADPRQAADAAADPSPPGRAVPALCHRDAGGPLRGLRDRLLSHLPDRGPRAQGPQALSAVAMSTLAFAGVSLAV